MRARLAIGSAQITVELREILLRDKAPELIAASPKATVPVLVIGSQVIEESLDIMRWALAENDPESWLNMPSSGYDLVEQSDTEFKPALDTYKYKDCMIERTKASEFLLQLNEILVNQPYLFGTKPSFADMAIITFVRQFAFVDKAWFDEQPWPNLSNWLERFIASDCFADIMQKYPKWQAADPPIYFP